ncbi:MAG: DNA-formamidopyrimidine glycosylase family protein, partial [Myxococcota bacterium]
MPELPEVEAGRKIAERTGRGHRIDAVTVADDPIVFEGVSPARIRRALRGRTVVDTHRHGKHFWLELDARPAVVFHFGMTGALYAYREQADRPRFWKIELVFDHGLRLAMTNARRLGRIRLRDNPGQEPPIADLGFDPYTEMPSPAEFASALRSRQGVVKGVLLNQSFAA